jgi:hypothetical protein
VRDVLLVGSRARGEETAWSDWDFLVETDDFEGLASELPSLVAPLAPLGQLWDPLSDDAVYYMLMLRGPVKVDLAFALPPRQQPPWTVTAETLCAVDAHFWDFGYWLAGKQAGGRGDIVRHLLPTTMATHILAPLGVEEIPVSLAHAVALYLPARERAEERLGVRVPRALGDEVGPVLLGERPR